MQFLVPRLRLGMLVLEALPPLFFPLQFLAQVGRPMAAGGHSPPYFRMGQSVLDLSFAPLALRSLSISLYALPFAMLRAVQP
jgi:hypothetical protein